MEERYQCTLGIQPTEVLTNEEWSVMETEIRSKFPEGMEFVSVHRVPIAYGIESMRITADLYASCAKLDDVIDAINGIENIYSTVIISFTKQ